LRLREKKVFKASVAIFREELISASRTIVGKPPLLVDLEKRLAVTEAALRICTAQSARSPLYTAQLLNAGQRLVFLSAKDALTASLDSCAQASASAFDARFAAEALAEAQAAAASALAAADGPTDADQLSSAERLAELAAAAGAAARAEASALAAWLEADSAASSALQDFHALHIGTDAESVRAALALGYFALPRADFAMPSPVAGACVGL
jgi:hypothetical protein